MYQTNTKVRWVDFVMISLGCALYAFGLVKINIANKLAEGGITGITLIIRYWLQIDPALSTIILNLPLIVIGYRYLGRTALIYTLFGTLSLSFFIWFWQRIPIQINIHHDLFIAGLLAGLLGGTGSGIVYRFGGTTGGTDIVARIFEKNQGISMGKTLLTLDAVVLSASLSYVDLRRMMYTLLASYVFSKIVTFTLEGAYAARGVIIISAQHEQIAQDIMQHLGRGVSYLHAMGGYSKKEYQAIYCVVSPSELMLLKHIVSDWDQRAFVSILSVNEVLGEGFSYDAPKRKLNLGGKSKKTY
ncbi:YitT family protein [Liquorilactobacillus satsumensis]|nr:YitT family protein [Liquorilactobacillus satsumensis]MCC7665971.1 YitT family protein [Liquorilactobacillus satsumensis]MCP9312069.1 YitT family protein [Liquorilactobacillus satsumensis]MCP9327844.1 YitT family protein [Liquorilactobacillus satsumensis]MCP9356677.1 YitT family protein [Liquorilactobacillus satsumensis]MCP9359347.1 YitT family protein [Liquorilactobacillus satsumensis]